jgi:hypothetical protein
MVIVYFLPRGVTGLVEDGWQALRRAIALPRGASWARLVRRQPTGAR